LHEITQYCELEYSFSISNVSDLSTSYIPSVNIYEKRGIYSLVTNFVILTINSDKNKIINEIKPKTYGRLTAIRQRKISD